MAPERARLFAELWVGPYQRLAPEWTLVADAGGRVVGYLTGCPDTRRFERARGFRVTLPLLAALLLGRYPWNRDARGFVRRAFGLARALEERFPARLRVDYPAHLHMNVADGLRGRGIGAALLGAYLDALASRGARGVHLLCGPGPVPFYARHGFREVARLDFARGGPVLALARPLP